MRPSPGTTPDAVARRAGPAPRGFLGMLALVAVVELVIAGRRLDFTTVAADDWRRTAEAATTLARGRDVLCFGDSLIKYGVLPRVVEAATGLKAYNLAINAGPMPAEYFLLERALAAGARPRAIVADFFALMLPDQPRGSIRAYPELASVANALDLARVAGDPDLGAAILLGKVLPSARCRFEVRASIAAALAGGRASPWPASRRIWATWKQHLGAQPMARGPGQPAANPALVADLTPDRWAVDPINAAYCERFLRLAGREGIPVFWVMPPLGAEVRAGRLAKGVDAAYAAFARQVQRRHPGLVVLDARGAGYGDSAHTDPIHLNEDGARVLSRDVAAAVAARLAGRAADRWVVLPAFAPDDPPAAAAVARRTSPD